jgi:hypothetical protein
MYKKFDFVASPQTFTAPFKGNYVFELWGAGGGGSSSSKGDTKVNTVTGKGGYLKASTALVKNYTLYVYTGKRGNDGGAASTSSGGAAGAAVWGGGGAGGRGHSYGSDYNSLGGGGSGGGATFISTRSHVSGIEDRATHDAGVLFAGGGGGSTGGNSSYAGHGTGDVTAGDGSVANGGVIYGASSSYGEVTGIGQTGRNGTSTPTDGGCGDHGGGGGGGGYKGGLAQRSTGHHTDAGGGGGNGYVASGYTAVSRLRGDASMPNSSGSPSDSGTMTGNTDNGAVRISYVP